jgi:hypothetical protein
MRYALLTLPVVLTLAPGPAMWPPGRAFQSKDVPSQHQRDFGSSLKNLEWDPQTKRAVDKAQLPATRPGKAEPEDLIKLETTLRCSPFQ